ncbi:acid-sensing ion channel 4 [Elysia marginata]|uniref:Acid-sensing ion channel 4 n=1 Tax=Elysia marginata TaxID=1093978 RepID=A0AAV4JZG5_9GAST|nr:acid-sensing ion channel 4 [Elysia marginata]
MYRVLQAHITNLRIVCSSVLILKVGGLGKFKVNCFPKAIATWHGQESNPRLPDFESEAVTILPRDPTYDPTRLSPSTEEGDRMLTTASHTLDELKHLEETILYRLQDSLDITRVYITQGNVSKMRVAKELTSAEVYEGINNLVHFFTGLRARGQDFYSGWSALADDQNAIWDMVLNDPDLEEFYQYRNMSDFLQDYSEVSMETEANFTGMRDTHDFRFLVGNLDSLFLKSLDDLMKDMHLFIDQSAVDADFIKKNFLQLDVFYREKSYEHIMSQEAYDVFALFCDIGGSMGLFVGASVLTLYEVVDLIFHQSLVTILHGSFFGPWLRRKMRSLSYSSERPTANTAAIDVGRSTF